jgi:glycine cleavage system H protein
MGTNQENYDIPSGYFYTKDHEWLMRKEDGNVLIGITDYAAKMLHDIVYVTLPSKGQLFTKKGVLGQVESVKTVSDIYSPISCTVLASNERLTKEPEIVSSSPYREGWMLEVRASTYDSEIKDLLDAEAYRKYVLALSAEESH